MTEFQNKSFSVYPGGTGGQEYRDNWDRVFGRKEKESHVGVMVSALQDTVHQDVVGGRAAKSVGKQKEKEPEPTVEPEPLLCEWCSADYFECICTIRI